MHVLLVDPDTRTVSAHQIEPQLDTTLSLLRCRTITGVRWHGCFIYCDDEGLFRATDETGRLNMTVLAGAEQPLVGRLLFFGPPTDDGYETDCPLSAHELADRITFITAVPPRPEWQFVRFGGSRCTE
jgi:hypothetical protein